MEHLRIHLPPGDPSLIDSIVSHLKSQGIFDEFRHDCLADVDTKPSYQNLSQRVDGYVSKFLSNEIWDPNQNKNELRNKLRRQIDESGMLALGVDHVVEQVVNAKTYHVFLPKIVEVVHQYLGIKTYPYNEKESILGKRIETSKDELTTGDNSRISPTQGLKSSAPVAITSTSSISSSVFNPTGSAVSWENTTLESLIKTEIGVKKVESKCPTEDLFPVKVYSKLGENLELVSCDSQDLKQKSDSGKLPNKTNELKLAHFKAGADNFKNKSENSKDVKLEKVDHCVSKHKQLDKKKEKSFEDIKPKVSDINLSSVVNSEIVIGLNTLESQDSKFKGDFKNDGKTNELKSQNVKNMSVNSMPKSETSKDLKSESTEQSVAKCMPFEKKKDLLHLQTKSKSSDVCLSSKDKSANSLESISFESQDMKQKANLKENLGKTNSSKFSSKISSESSKVKSECDKSTKFEKVEPSATKHKKKDKKKDKSFEETKSKLSETRLLPKDKNMNLEKNKSSNTLPKEKTKSKIPENDKVKLKPKNQSSEKCQTHKSKTSTSDTHKSDVKVINKNVPHLKHSTEKSKTTSAVNKLSNTKNKVSLQEQKESSSSTMFKKKKDLGSSDKLNTAIEKTHLSKGSDSQKRKAQAIKPYCKADNNPDKHHHTQKGMNSRETKIGSKQDLVSHKDKRIKLNSPSSSPYESSQGSDQERNWSKKASFPQPKKTEKNPIKDSIRKNETKLFDVSAESEASEGGLACGRHSNTLRQVLDNTKGKKISALGSVSSETSPAENISTKDSDSSSEGEIFEDTSPGKNKILKSRKRKKKSCKDEKRCDTPPSSPPSPSSSLALPRHSHTQSPEEDKYKRNSKSDTSKKGNEFSARNAKTKEAQLSDISGYQRLESSSEATLFSPTVPEKGSSLRTKDEDLNSQGNMSDVTISSVHTSDLSSFDDGISLSSSDEDMCDKKAVVKKKRKVPLKEASELIKNDESDFSEESEKQSVNSCHSEESGDVEDSHHSDEKTSCDIPALGVEFKRELRRERKLNPKYTSSDYTSIFSHSRDLRSETAETVSRNSCKGNNHSNSEPSEGSIAKKYSSKSKSCAKDLVKVEMPNFVAGKRDKHLNSLSEIQAVCESDEELSVQKCKKRNISEVSDSDCQYTISLKIRKVSGQESGDEIKNNSEKTHSSSESLSDEEESKSYSNKKMASKSNLTESPKKVITKYSADENIASCSSEVSEHDNKEIVPVTLKSTRNSKKTSKRRTRVSNCDSYSIDKELKGSDRKTLVSNKSKLGKEPPRKSIPRITIHCRAKKEAARRLMRNCYTRPKRYQNGSTQSSSDEEEVSDEKEKREDQNRLPVKSKGGHCQKRMSKDTNIMTDSKQVPGKFETLKESKKVMDLPSSGTLVGRTNNRRRKSKDLSLDQSKCNSTVKSDVQQRSSKWYDSSDLYKPRPVIPSGTRRSRVRMPPAFP